MCQHRCCPVLCQSSVMPDCKGILNYFSLAPLLVNSLLFGLNVVTLHVLQHTMNFPMRPPLLCTFFLCLWQNFVVCALPWRLLWTHRRVGISVRFSLVILRVQSATTRLATPHTYIHTYIFTLLTHEIGINFVGIQGVKCGNEGGTHPP